MEHLRLLDGRLKLRHLLLVDALTEQGSVVGAAAAMHITQPVATRSLHDLEDILGVQLYERGPRGITPTEFGIAFTEHARAVLAQLTQAARHVDEIADATRGRVVVGTHLAGSNLLLPRAIARVKHDRPLLNVVVHEATPEALLVELSAGRVDVIVGRLTGQSTEHTRRTTLYEESIRVVTGADHPLAGRTRVTFEDLWEYPWILPGVETILRQELAEFFVRNGHDLPANRVEATSFLTVRQLLIETEMIAVLPGLIGADDPLLTTVPMSLEPIGHSVGITLAADRRMTPTVRALIDALETTASEIYDPMP
ncbi:DNA-binding transcriptional LysR family regulator [Prauserella sediminis]|uniref:DNA-binding transcriptional LysR family regulator n=1 Tax=Prauserella sediminis TaxID=577680 RepID=A0A839XMF0_9PSEU|nr:LysR substrate-binding domain-containing protein [Prauserella sediminis]MBB3664450.1 DNA-binding transcriptional LysR family regulator [Prauserella sediminis]